MSPASPSMRDALAKCYVQLSARFELGAVAGVLGVGIEEAVTIIEAAEVAGFVTPVDGALWSFTDKGVAECVG